MASANHSTDNRRHNDMQRSRKNKKTFHPYPDWQSHPLADTLPYKPQGRKLKTFSECYRTSHHNLNIFQGFCYLHHHHWFRLLPPLHRLLQLHMVISPPLPALGRQGNSHRKNLCTSSSKDPSSGWPTTSYLDHPTTPTTTSTYWPSRGPTQEEPTNSPHQTLFFWLTVTNSSPIKNPQHHTNQTHYTSHGKPWWISQTLEPSHS